MSKPASEIPEQLFYKIGEVCQITDTQPYVLRFWESEFPQLSPKKSRSGQRVYQRKDIEMIVRIKELLYQEEYTIAGARKKLEEEAAAGRAGGGTARADTAKKARGAGRSGEAREAEHPVDALEERVSRMKRESPASRHAAGDRDGRVEKALGDVKSSLKEILAILRQD